LPAGRDSVRYTLLAMPTAAPNLPLVIGLPVGLMVIAMAIAVGTFLVISRIAR
jgi:hypothetical protein